MILGISSELQVKPLHEYLLGEHGSPCQSSLEILEVCLMSTTAVTVVYKKMLLKIIIIQKKLKGGIRNLEYLLYNMKSTKE